MVTAKEKIQNPIYQELSGLVLTTEKLRTKWFKNQKELVFNEFRGTVRPSSLSRFEHELDSLASKVNACRAEYDRVISHWDKKPTWTNFPHMYKEYRDMITHLSQQRAKMVGEINIMREEKRSAKRVQIDTAVPRKAEAPKIPAPPKKKATFWKGAALAAGLVGGAWFLSEKASSDNSETAETTSVRHARVVHVVKTQKTQPAPASKYTVSGPAYTIVTTSTSRPSSSSSSLLPRLQDAVDRSYTLSSSDVQASANAAAIANNLSSISYSKRNINYNEQYMKVDTARSWRDTAEAVKDTTREIKETTRELNGAYNGFRDMFKKNR